MGRVVRDNAVSVIEGFLGVHKGYSVPLLIDGVLLVIPLERVFYHTMIRMKVWVLLPPCTEGKGSPPSLIESFSVV